MAEKNYSILLSLGNYLLRYKRVLVGAGIALVFTAAVTLSMGQGVRLIIDNGFIAGSSEELNRTALLIIAIACFMAVGTYVRFYLVSWLGERVSADIRRDVFNHLITLHPLFRIQSVRRNHVAADYRYDPSTNRRRFISVYGFTFDAYLYWWPDNAVSNQSQAQRIGFIMCSRCVGTYLIVRTTS